MNQFFIFLKLGFSHIADPQAYDHLLFIITLCALYPIRAWKRILILVTAFTIGHSITLALSALDILRIPSDLVEFLIPVTILITALYNILSPSNALDTSKRQAVVFHYTLALVFGLIHGMGFSNYFRTLMGESSAILMPLFSFNLGIEIGQLLIVAVFFLVYKIFSELFNIKHREWNVFFSGAGAGIALTLILDNILKS